MLDFLKEEKLYAFLPSFLQRIAQSILKLFLVFISLKYVKKIYQSKQNKIENISEVHTSFFQHNSFRNLKYC